MVPFLRRFHYYVDLGFSLVRGGVTLPMWMQGIYVRLFLVLVLGGVSLGFVLQISKTAVSGYEIHNLENEIAVLERDSKRLEAEVAQFSSLNSFNQRKNNIGMEPIDHVNYLSASDSNTVAKN